MTATWQILHANRLVLVLRMHTKVLTFVYMASYVLIFLDFQKII